MKKISRKLLISVPVLLCLVSSSFAMKPHRDRRCDYGHVRDCRQVPEGGSALVYLLGAGLTCAGAMIIRSKRDKLQQA